VKEELRGAAVFVVTEELRGRGPGAAFGIRRAEPVTKRFQARIVKSRAPNEMGLEPLINGESSGGRETLPGKGRIARTRWNTTDKRI